MQLWNLNYEEMEVQDEGPCVRVITEHSGTIQVTRVCVCVCVCNVLTVCVCIYIIMFVCVAVPGTTRTQPCVFRRSRPLSLGPQWSPPRQV